MFLLVGYVECEEDEKVKLLNECENEVATDTLLTTSTSTKRTVPLTPRREPRM